MDRQEIGLDAEDDVAENRRVVVIFLRALRGWDQQALAEASGISASSISRYEAGERTPSPEAMAQMARSVGMPPSMLRRMESWVQIARSTIRLKNAVGDSAEATVAKASNYADEMSDFFQAMALLVLSNLKSGEPAPRVQQPRPEHREMALRLWENLEPMAASARRLLVEEDDDYHSWALCELLCAKSLEAEDGEQALELAELAREVAERTSLETEWYYRLSGYAWAHVGNARRRLGDQAGAEEAFAQFQEDWEEGEPRDPGLLDEERVRRVVEG